jgi:cation:H+ antiporter
MPSVLLIVGGLAALIVGAELLVRGGTGLATWFGIRPMVIGLTVVSLGTSVPELAIGVDATVSGSPGLAVGNIVGANLVNVLLVLGLSALLVPLVFQRRTLRFELPAMTAAALALYLLSLDGTLVPAEGLLLLVGGAAYTWALLRINRRDSPDMASDTPVDAVRGDVAVLAQGGHRPLRDTGALLAGMLLIVLGAELLVEGAVSGAESLGVSEAVIGLTVVAVGTTAPELVTTLVSTMRGDRDIAIGNLLGSSVYNIAVVLGLVVVVAPEGVPVPDEVLAADLVLLAVVAVATVPVFVSGARITRVEGDTLRRHLPRLPVLAAAGADLIVPQRPPQTGQRRMAAAGRRPGTSSRRTANSCDRHRSTSPTAGRSRTLAWCAGAIAP